MQECVMDSPFGRLCIQADSEGITALFRTDKPIFPPESALLLEAVQQLHAYFDGSLIHFDLPFHMAGTDFQLRCWKALLTIPYGETISYGEQARRIGQPKATRAVGGANHRNPICIIVPCHRVVGANGALTGYGEGLNMKEWLLRHEQKMIRK